MKTANAAQNLTRGGRLGAHRETKQSLGLDFSKVKGRWGRAKVSGSKPAVSA
jgi:hypothetical protein